MHVNALFNNFNLRIVITMTDHILPEERRSEILNILLEEGKLTVPDLSKRLQVSVDTIRRDLIELEHAGHLSRVHGGALPKSPSTRPYLIREKEQSTSVSRIAKAAAGLIKKGQVIFLDSGTTVVEVARSLPITLQATIVTTNPRVVVALSEHTEIQVIVLPGFLNRETMSVTGANTLKALKKIRADICILGVCAIHNEIGITATNYEEAEVKRQMILNSSETVIAVTSDKLGTAVTFEVANIECIARLVTESTENNEVLKPYKQTGIEIITAA